MILTSQTANSIEELFNARLPPSRRLDQYKPLKSDLAGSDSNEKGASVNSDSSGNGPIEWQPQETLQDEEDTYQSRLRAEVSDDLTLGKVDSRVSRRGSDMTMIGDTLNLRRPSHIAKDPEQSEKQESLVKRLGKKKAKRVADGLGAEEHGNFYDMSVWRAIFLSIRKQWIGCVLTLGIACESHHTWCSDGCSR